MRRTGPNNTFRVVWAISEFFFSLLFVFFIFTNYLTGINDILELRMYLWGATTKRTGPNDTKHVIWAISEFFFFFIIIRVFYIY